MSSASTTRKGGLIRGRKNGIEPVQDLETRELGSFAIAGEDCQWNLARAVIPGSEAAVRLDEIAAPAALRCGYCQDPDSSNLYNTALLLASLAKTDSRQGGIDKWRR